jgi:hypothetical protein
MANFRASSHHLRNGASNAAVIRDAVSSHPVRHLTAGDLGHAGLSAALNGFRDAWASEYTLRRKAAAEARRLLATAASDTEHVDRILAHAATGLGGKQ